MRKKLVTLKGNFKIPKICLSVLFSFGILLSGCTSKIRPYTTEEGVAQLSAQATQIKNMRGRAWVSVNSKDNGSSFPAIVVIDFSNKNQPKMRIEAIDPLGSTHAIGILSDRCFSLKKIKQAAPVCLTWLDLDHKTIRHHVRSWNGFPLEELPYFMIGISSLQGVVGRSGSEGEGFDFQRSFFRMHLDLTWIDPGPRLALNAIQGKLTTGEEFQVHYSSYMDTPDFYLPKQVELKAPVLGFEATLKWRERTWDGVVDAKVFELSDRMLESLLKDSKN